MWLVGAGLMELLLAVGNRMIYRPSQELVDTSVLSGVCYATSLAFVATVYAYHGDVSWCSNHAPGTVKTKHGHESKLQAIFFCNDRRKTSVQFGSVKGLFQALLKCEGSGLI